MMLMCHRAPPPAIRATIPIMSEASIQTELLREDAAFSTASAWGLSLRLGQRETVSLPAEGMQWYRICVAKEVQEEVSRLCGIRDSEKEINWISFRTLQPEPSAVLKEDQVVCAYWVRKRQRLEACDFWQQEEGSCSTCISPAKEQVQYPCSR